MTKHSLLMALILLCLTTLLYACDSGDNQEKPAATEETEAPDVLEDDKEHGMVGENGEGGNEEEESTDDNGASTEGESTETESVLVTLINNEEEEIGTANLEETNEGVSIQLEASHLPKDTEHGFHIHETGSCLPPDFESAEGHYNPSDNDHGFNSEKGPHAGDLPNITTDENGEVNEEVTAKYVTLEKGQDNSLLNDEGTALVIHADPDDYESQPSGDAGDRIACGVITDQAE